MGGQSPVYFLKEDEMPNKTSIKIDKDLNRQLSIFSLLEKKKKEDFINELLTNSLEKYQKKYNRYRFK